MEELETMATASEDESTSQEIDNVTEQMAKVGLNTGDNDKHKDSDDDSSSSDDSDSTESDDATTETDESEGESEDSVNDDNVCTDFSVCVDSDKQTIEEDVPKHTTDTDTSIINHI